ncbi:MAG: acetylornithine deacetylase/succinyl-diaminopimelate desuccinylase family protein [Acidobacteriota bacterium]|nr:acetylornithine deacetylase/succinyl-diaminopimelate desuccinylase family protein [Acidobacteriota bacterium]MDQ3417250.1 acetylornithine deacetylase/succinyl-diaminopimelate desuccinylase family protein [Acidobacteriota bacterium]
MVSPDIDRVLAAVDASADELVAFTADLIRIPTVNPPGELYEDCARLIGDRLALGGFEVEYHAAEGRPEHTSAHPRVNVVGLRRGRALRPAVHLNGHFDVVPAGAGWTLDPFGGVVRDGRVYGRGACDMKAGIAAAVYAAEAIRRAGVELNGSIEISGTVDEESGGFAGVAWLAQQKRLSADRQDFVIIPEPLNVDRICIGHRGVYWFEVTTHGRIGHGSMPFLGVSAIEHMGVILDRMRRELLPALASRTTGVPVVPDGARHATLNINGIMGGQDVNGIQTPCVADLCRAVFDRRFLLEEGFDATRAEIQALLDRATAETPQLAYALRDLMVVHPVRTPEGSPLVASLERGIQHVLGRPAVQIASPGTYDHKHVDRIAGIPNCVAYGPGILDLAHQPDEWCGIDDLVNSTKVLALSVLELTQTTGH